MQKLNELRMTLIILLIGLFFISGCFFNSNHTVTFKTNGGTEVKNVTVKSGSKLSDIETPKKDGYVFEGWYLDGEEFDINTKIEEDITLVAKWTKDTYKTEEVIDGVEDDTTENPTTSTTTTETTTTKSKTSTTSTKALGTKTTTSSKKTSTTKKTTTTTTTTSTTTTQVVTTTAAPSESDKTDDEEDKDDDKTPDVDPTIIDVGIRIDVVGIDPLPEFEEDEEEIDEEENETDEKDDNDQEDEETSQSLGYIKISKIEDISDSNVKSSLDKEKIEALISNFDKWENITTNRGNVYDVKEGYTTDVTDDTLKLVGDIDVTSFTVVFEDTSYAFELIEDTWYISLATASLEIEGIMGITYYNNLETAIKVANENVIDLENAKQIITIYENQKINSPLYINQSISIIGYERFDDKYVITNEEGYLFDLTNIVLEDDAEFTFELKNIDFKVDKFINLGSLNTQNIKLSNVNITINDEDNKEELSDLFDSEDVTVYSLF